VFELIKAEAAGSTKRRISQAQVRRSMCGWDRVTQQRRRSCLQDEEPAEAGRLLKDGG
jgi:hypothetical protein